MSPEAFVDRFEEPRVPGEVVGLPGAKKILRDGVDTEGVIGIDHEALRIQPLLQPGWGRSGISYGPYKRQNGLAFGTLILNGHNTSQTGNINQSLFRRLGRWLLGSGADPLGQRFWSWLRFGHKKLFIRQLRSWLFLNRNYGNGRLPELDENLAVGWFLQENPKDPLVDSNAFIVHALGANNGELWVQSAGQSLAVVSGLQNIPIFYLVILREYGAAYYVASLPYALGMVGYPEMRPLAIDGANQDSSLNAGVHQSVLGQIGFRVDTRVYSTQVGQIEEFDQWYGTAHAADRLFGTGLLNDSDAETGQPWRVPAGRFVRSSEGVRGLDAWNLACLNPGKPSGLIHMILDELPEDKQLQVYWRYLDNNNYWCLSLGSQGYQLDLKENGKLKQIAGQNESNPGESHHSAIQILDNGKQIDLFLNGKPLFENGFTDERLADAGGVGFGCQVSKDVLHLHHFEAHPRSLPIPDEFLQKTPWLPSEAQVVMEDDFDGAQSDLQGREIPQINEIWQRTLGSGIMQVGGNGSLQVLASVEQPNPDRTAYTFAWQDPHYADLEIEITPPGTARGEWEKGRGGFIFWQDELNYLIVNTWLDDFYEGASISSFLKLRGFEDLYDAVWTNVGERITWGVPYKLRTVFDGQHYLVYLNQEPVLYRALTDIYIDSPRLNLTRVGLIVNWEWGHDTGSVFNHFVARKRLRG